MSKDIQRALNIQLGLASDDETPELGGDVEAVAETAAVAEGAVEVADATDEVVEADQTVDELSEAHENLEEVSEALEEAAANGGISQESARFAHLAIKAACGRFYSPAIASALPSVESFTGSSSRQRNTTIALESVGTMLRSFWDAIVRQIKKLWATVKNWYQKVLGAAAGIKKKADSLSEAASKLSGTPAEKTFDIGVLRTLHISGKAPTPEQAMSVITGMAKIADDLLGSKTSGEYENIAENFEDMVDAISDAPEAKFTAANQTLYGLYSDVDHGTAKLLAGLTTFSSHASRTIQAVGVGNVVANTNDRFGAAAEVTISGTNELFGGRAIVIRTLAKGMFNGGNNAPTNAGDRMTIARTGRYAAPAIEEYHAKPKEVDGTGTFKTLSPAQMRTICDEISDAMDHVRTYEKAWQMRDKQSKKIETVGKKAMANVEKDKDAKPLKIRAVKDVAQGMASFYQSGLRFESAFINGLMQDSRALMTWVERSIAQYK